MAAEDTAAEMRKSLSEEEKDAGVQDEAPTMVPQALEDDLKADNPAMKRSSGEKLKALEEEMVPEDEEEAPAGGLGVPQQDVILPEY